MLDCGVDDLNVLWSNVFGNVLEIPSLYVLSFFFMFFFVTCFCCFFCGEEKGMNGV